MTISQKQFPRFAFALHRHYLYSNWASQVNDILSSPEEDDKTNIDKLKPLSRECNLLSLFQCRMKNNPGFQQYILSCISKDTALVQRTIDYLRYLRETHEFDKENMLFGKPVTVNSIEPTDKFETGYYVAFHHTIDNPGPILDAISTVRTREDATTLRVLKRAGCLNSAVRCNAIGIFASKRFEDPYIYQTLKVDWCTYIHQHGFLPDVERGRYTDVLDMHEDIGMEIYRAETYNSSAYPPSEKTIPVFITVTVESKKRDQHDNLYQSIPRLDKIRKEAAEFFIPDTEPLEFSDNDNVSDAEMIFKNITNEFLTIATELWFISQSDSNRLKLLHKEFSEHDDPPKNEDQVMISVTPTDGKKLDEPSSDRHPLGSEKEYAIIFKNPSVVDSELVPEIKKAEEEIMGDCRTIAIYPWEMVNSAFKEKEKEILQMYSEKLGKIASLYLVSKMYLNYYWLHASSKWFQRSTAKEVQQLPEKEAFVLNQLRCEYWLKTGKTFAQTAMAEAEKRIQEGFQEDVLWEFWFRYSKAALQNHDYDKLKECYTKLAGIDLQYPYFRKECVILDDVLKDVIKINKTNLKKYSSDAISYFMKADAESCKLALETTDSDEKIDASLPLLNYALGLDSYLRAAVWGNIPKYIDENLADPGKAKSSLSSPWWDIFKNRKYPSLGVWANLYLREYMSPTKDNLVLFLMCQYLQNNFGEQIVKAVSSAAASVHEYRNKICHANPKFMSLTEFKEKRCEIIKTINTLFEAMK